MRFRLREDSGRLWLDDDTVWYESRTYPSWRLPVDEIRLIGEVTNQNGPFLDDYFFCFATDDSGWLEASLYADGRDEFLRALGTRLGAVLTPCLSDSTDFKSRILWPLHAVDHPMFEFTDAEPRGVWKWINFLLPSKKKQTISSQARQVLAGR